MEVPLSSATTNALPNYEHAKKTLEYILTVNSNNESRLNVYVTLNTAIIGALGLVYRGIAGPLIFELCVWIPALFAILLFITSLFLALSASKSKVVDPSSPMITRWIAGVSIEQIQIENGSLIGWMAHHFSAAPAIAGEIHQAKFEEYLLRCRNAKKDDAEWEVKAIMRETFALAHAARDRAVGLKFVRRVFGWGIATLLLTFVMDFAVRVYLAV